MEARVGGGGVCGVTGGARISLGLGTSGEGR